MPSFLLSFLRLWVLLAITGWYLLPLLIRQWLGGIDYQRALTVRSIWARKIMRPMGVIVEKRGEVPDYPVIFISNHRSYFDPVVTLKYAKAFPIAKAEVSTWPLIGFAAKATGVLYVKREDKNSRRQALEDLWEHYQMGRSIYICPEGTTTGLPTTTIFRKGSFQIAARESITIIPIAIEYKDKRDYWIGSATFVPHFFKCFGKTRTYVRIRFGPPMTDSDPELLLQKTQNWINSQLLEMQQNWQLQTPAD